MALHAIVVEVVLQMTGIVRGFIICLVASETCRRSILIAVRMAVHAGYGVVCTGQLELRLAVIE